MKLLPKFFAFALGALLTLAGLPAAQAQVSVNVQVGAPAWGPPVPAGVQYYYIPEIDGYYDLYTQQYIVFQDGYWVPLPQLYGYDPYLFHPVVLDYRGAEPWQFRDYYHRRYAYVPYQPYRGGYYTGGLGRPGYGRRYDNGQPNQGNNRNYTTSPNPNRGENYGAGRGDQPQSQPPVQAGPGRGGFQPGGSPGPQGGGRGGAAGQGQPQRGGGGRSDGGGRRGR